MKFHELPIGSRFVYDGASLVKAGPLTASDAQGNHRIIPRAAAVRSQDEPAPPDGPGAVGDAYAVLRNGVEQLIDNLGDALGNTRLLALKADLARLEKAFLVKTGIGGVVDARRPPRSGSD